MEHFKIQKSQNFGNFKPNFPKFLICDCWEYFVKFFERDEFGCTWLEV